MITADQIRAGRGLLGWSQTELSKRTGLSTPAIGNIEIEKHKPTLETQAKIIRAFDEAGIEVIDEGVRRKRDKITILEGDDAFLRLFDDMYYTICNSPQKDVLVICADEKVTPPEGIEKIRLIRQAGGKFRHIIEEGDHYMLGPINEYKWLPKEYFINRVTLIYGDKVAFACEEPHYFITIIHDVNLSKTQKNFFEFCWNNLKRPTWSETERVF